MTDFNTYTCSFIGLGLIGGSIAKALRQSFQGIRINAYDISEPSLQMAKAEKVADYIFSSFSPDLFCCDFLFLCAPVSNNDQLLSQLKSSLSPDCILTDVGSVKHTTHETIFSLNLSNQFIGGHPMAGSENTGYECSNPLLLENAYYILTPTKEVSSDKIRIFQELITAIGAIPLILDYTKHDIITAAVSHLPHIIASSLVNLVQDSDDSDELMKMIAAGGFKDITRIASSSPVMWQSVCMTNAENISVLLKNYILSLQKILSDLETSDSDNLYQLFERAKEYRDSFLNEGHGPIKKIHSIFVDIPDKPGALAQTAVLLAERNLSIKNIGIMHSREFQEGALRIEFYEEHTASVAAQLLREHSYTIYE